MLVRALLVVPCVLLGGGVAVCTVLLHGYPWGLLLGLAATAAVLVALPGGWWSRLPFAVGWAAALVALTLERAEGDYLVASDASGYVLLAAGAVVLGAGFTGLLPRRAQAPDAERQPSAP